MFRLSLKLYYTSTLFSYCLKVNIRRLIFFKTYVRHNVGIISIVCTFTKYFKYCRNNFESGFCVIYMYFAKCKAIDLFIDIFYDLLSISQSSHCHDVSLLFSLIGLGQDNIRLLVP